MVAKKDYDAPKHVELDVKNLFVIKACQSLNSRGFIKTQFSWKVTCNFNLPNQMPFSKYN
jgi:small subunit ribosomal protein S10e